MVGRLVNTAMNWKGYEKSRRGLISGKIIQNFDPETFEYEAEY
jgi:hypothetical protein